MDRHTPRARSRPVFSLVLLNCVNISTKVVNHIKKFQSLYSASFRQKKVIDDIVQIISFDVM